MLYNETPEVNPRREDRFAIFYEEVSPIYRQAEDAFNKTKAHFNATKGETGRKEEEDFWGKLERKVNRKMERFMVKMEKLELLKEKFERRMWQCKRKGNPPQKANKHKKT